MRREIHGWHSPSLHKHMDLVVYGHYGFALLLLPTAAADFLEYERFNLIDAIAHHIESGKVKVFSINSINSESWLNNHMDPRHKALRHAQFNEYVNNEVVPFIKNFTSRETPIILSGASLGAFHGANLFFKRPDLFAGVIAMSGTYDLKIFTGGYWDENVYFNSPVHYLVKLNDDYWLPMLQHSSHIHILTGSGDYEQPNESHRLSHVLNMKNIPHEIDVWGPDMTHDWPTWRAMLPYYLESRF